MFREFIRHKYRRWPVRTWQCLASYVARRLVCSDLHIDMKQNRSNRLHAPATPSRILGQVNIVSCLANDQLFYTYPLHCDRSKALKFAITPCIRYWPYFLFQIRDVGHFANVTRLIISNGTSFPQKVWAGTNLPTKLNILDQHWNSCSN